MGKNQYFPHWITSNIIISSFLDEFGAHAEPEKDDASSIQLTFIPERFFYVVPEEDRERFTDIYNIFAGWAANELGLANILEKYFYEIVDQRTMHSIQAEVHRAMMVYEQHNGIGIKQILSACLGIESSALLPKEIAKQLEELTGVKRTGGIKIEWHMDDH